MKNKRHDSVEVLGILRKFFFVDLADFGEQEPSGRSMFVRKFGDKGLKIVVTTPVICFATEPKALAKGMHIRFAVHHWKAGECLVLKDTVFTEGWEKVAKKKILALIDLIEAAPRCPTCEATMYPVQDKDHQVNPKGTYYVWFACSGSRSHECRDTPYRTGLKTRLHRFIVKKYD